MLCVGIIYLINPFSISIQVKTDNLNCTPIFLYLIIHNEHRYNLKFKHLYWRKNEHKLIFYFIYYYMLLKRYEGEYDRILFNKSWTISKNKYISLHDIKLTSKKSSVKLNYE